MVNDLPNSPIFSLAKIFPRTIIYEEPTNEELKDDEVVDEKEEKKLMMRKRLEISTFSHL